MTAGEKALTVPERLDLLEQAVEANANVAGDIMRMLRERKGDQKGAKA
jgi:hypothetical protein